MTDPIDAVLARAKSPSGVINEGDAGMLADEVTRLREENARLKVDHEFATKRWAADVDTLARVEALPAKWRKEERGGVEPANTGTDCAVELEAALKDTP